MLILAFTNKTRVFFSKNVSWQVKEVIKYLLGYQWTYDLGKYLGVPIFHNRGNQNTYLFIIDKVNQYLSAWKVRNLSLAGRVTLTKSILQARPLYVMQTTWLPKSICEEIDMKCHYFVWGDTYQQRIIHMASLKFVCYLKAKVV